jgi:hypothetical protein
MAARRFSSIAGVLVVGLVIIWAVRSPGNPSVEELARRVAACHPTWQNYQEDIKGQIGAAPVAQWRGTLIETRCENTLVSVTFQLSGPWAQRDITIPILVREPSGNWFEGTQTHRQAARATYTCQLPEDTANLPFPWLEIRYPHGEKRVVLSSQGHWKAAPTP